MSNNSDPNKRIEDINQRFASAEQRAQALIAQQRAAEIARFRRDAERLAAKMRQQEEERYRPAREARAKVEAEAQQKAEAQLKLRLRASWQGDDSSFERNWIALRDAYYTKQALGGADSVLENKRKQYEREGLL